MAANRQGTGFGLRERKKRQTHNRIRDAAVSLFVSYGFDNTTVDAIALEAGISKPTLFNYFPSKAAILHELLDSMDARFVSYITAELHNVASTQDRLQDFMMRSATDIMETPALTRLLMVEGFGAIGDTGTSKARFSLLQQAMEKLVRAGRKQGDVRKDYPIDLLVLMLVGGYLQVLLNWLSDQEYDLKKNLRNTARFLGEAIAPPINTQEN